MDKGVSRKVVIGIFAFLLLYALFTLGFIFEVTGSDAINRVDIPYSIALSGERTGVIGIYSQSDVECAGWLADFLQWEYTPQYSVSADYNGTALLTGLGIASTYETGEGERFYFMTSWNTRHDMQVMASAPGLRYHVPLPDLTYAIEVYRVGDTVVYYLPY